MNRFLANIGKFVLGFLGYLGGLSHLTRRTFSTIFKGLVSPKLVMEQVYYLGVKSLSLTNLVAIFTGMVLSLQFIVSLKRFGLELYTGQVVGLAIMRELGPVLTAIMVAARVGSGIASELGSMTVTEQVEAIEAMGANPIAKLVLPRILAVVLVTPILSVFADVVGIFGGMVVTWLEAGVSFQFYFDQVSRTVQFEDFNSGIYKTFFFGFLISLIACYEGLNTKKGTQGVGQATTRSVVYSCLAIFVADYFLTKIFIIL